MKTELEDIKGRALKIGDTIAMCGYTYSLEKWGQAGKEYWFHTGKIFFKKGRVQWSGTSDYDHKLYDNNFLIIKRGKKLMAKVDKRWDWEGTDLG